MPQPTLSARADEGGGVLGVLREHQQVRVVLPPLNLEDRLDAVPSGRSHVPGAGLGLRRDLGLVHGVHVRDLRDEVVAADGRCHDRHEARFVLRTVEVLDLRVEGLDHGRLVRTRVVVRAGEREEQDHVVLRGQEPGGRDARKVHEPAVLFGPERIDLLSRHLHRHLIVAVGVDQVKVEHLALVHVLGRQVLGDGPDDGGETRVLQRRGLGLGDDDVGLRDHLDAPQVLIPRGRLDLDLALLADDGGELEPAQLDLAGTVETDRDQRFERDAVFADLAREGVDADDEGAEILLGLHDGFLLTASGIAGGVMGRSFPGDMPEVQNGLSRFIADRAMNRTAGDEWSVLHAE